MPSYDPPTDEQMQTHRLGVFYALLLGGGALTLSLVAALLILLGNTSMRIDWFGIEFESRLADPQTGLTTLP